MFRQLLQSMNGKFFNIREKGFVLFLYVWFVFFKNNEGGIALIYIGGSSNHASKTFLNAIIVSVMVQPVL